jgi:hypothetical protein
VNARKDPSILAFINNDVTQDSQRFVLLTFGLQGKDVSTTTASADIQHIIIVTVS